MSYIGSTLGFGPSGGSSILSVPTNKQLKQILMGKLKLGDKVEKVIKAVAPKFHEKKKNCSACARRKARLNKI